MILNETHIIKQNHTHFAECDKICFLSKNLYNYANYLVRQEFIGTSKQKQAGEASGATFLNFHQIRRTVINQIDYTSLPRKVSNEILKQLNQNWLSFFKAIKDWKKNPGKYKGMPKLPGYKHKTKGRSVATYDLQAISKKILRQNKVKLSGTSIEIPFINFEHKLKQVRIVPGNDQYKIEIIYDKQIKINENLKKENKAAIDLGLNNLMALTFSLRGAEPIIINGRPLKSMNQFYNKRKAQLQSKLPKNMHVSHNILKLTNKRNNKVKDYIHNATSFVVDKLENKLISELVIGLNTDWKQEINIGSKNNQNFVSIPFRMIIDQLVYKCKLIGINVIVREEAHTSKCSFLDMEPVCHQEKYAGNRKHRGLFQSKNKHLLNADVNGSYNIMRKEFPELFQYGIEGFAVNPQMIYHFKQAA